MILSFKIMNFVISVYLKKYISRFVNHLMYFVQYSNEYNTTTVLFISYSVIRFCIDKECLNVVRPTVDLIKKVCKTFESV